MLFIINRWINEKCSAAHLFDEMQTKNIQPNEKLYSIMINGYVKNNQFDEATQLFQEMKNKNLPPTIFHYSILIGGFAKEKKT